MAVQRCGRVLRVAKVFFNKSECSSSRVAKVNVQLPMGLELCREIDKDEFYMLRGIVVRIGLLGSHERRVVA